MHHASPPLIPHPTLLSALPYLLRNANDTASGTGTRVARSLTLLVSALAQVIRAGMHDDRPAQDALRSDQLDQLVRDGPLGVALAVGFEVAEVADVAFAVGGGAVGFGERVEVGSSACAAVGVVTELVDVHAALGRGVVAADVVGDGCRGGFGRLLEGDGAADLGVTAEDCDCFDHCDF